MSITPLVEKPMRRAAFLLALAAVTAVVASPVTASLAAQATPTVVVIVRHADKAATPANDPPLTAVGVERALTLAEFLKDAKVGAVLHTPTTRTRETARPTAERFGLTPEIVPTGPMPAVSAAIVEMVRKHAGQTILIVGHSNTVMPWIAALGGPKRENLCDHQYDGSYTLIIDGNSVRLVEGRYGPPNPAQAAPCATIGGAAVPLLQRGASVAEVPAGRQITSRSRPARPKGPGAIPDLRRLVLGDPH